MLKIAVGDIKKLSEQEISRAYNIMRHAYEVTEVDIWGENYVRVSMDEFRCLIEKGEIIIAWLNNELVGSIHTYPISENTFCFGLLSADFDKKGHGIGRGLIQAAEEKAKKESATHMTLEILKPQEFEVPFKVLLHDWYVRLGYKYTHSISFIERKPDKIEKAKRLIVPSVFDCYEKSL